MVDSEKIDRSVNGEFFVCGSVFTTLEKKRISFRFIFVFSEFCVWHSTKGVPHQGEIILRW